MCKVLTGREMPAWINRAARVGTALPCLVPKEWASAAETYEAGGASEYNQLTTQSGRGAAYGTTLDSETEDDEDEDEDERAGILWHGRRRPPQQRYYDDPEEEERARGGRDGAQQRERRTDVALRGKGKAWRKMVRDTDGRGLPASEVAPPERLI